MDQLLTILAIAGLFLLRIGGPVLILVILGILIDRWQTRREDQLRQRYAPELKVLPSDDEDEANQVAA